MHTFEDIAEGASNPVIIADEPFWWYAPTSSLNVELAVLQYPSTGYVTSVPLALAQAPEVGATLEPRTNGVIAPAVTTAKVIGAQPEIGAADTTNVVSAVSVVELDGSAFTPDGTIKDVLLKVELTGDGDYTPFLYGAHAAYAATFDVTDDSEQFDITPYIVKSEGVSLNVPDDPGGVSFEFTLKSPETIQGADVAKLLTLGNRPAQVRIGTNIIIDGVMTEPEFIDAVYDDAARLKCTIRDRLWIAQQLQFRERVPLDDVPLCETEDATNYWESAVQFIAYQAGILNTEMDLDAIGFTIPNRPSDDLYEAFQTLIEIGSSPYDELARLVGTYASGFAWRMKPQPSAAMPKLLFYDPDNLSGTPDYVLYRTETDAIAGGGAATDLYYAYNEQPLPIDANEVRCTGYDTRTKRTVQAFKVDAASQDPTTAPSSRPDNWLGLPRVVGIIDPRFNSENACIKAVEAIFPRVTPRYWISTFTSELLFKSTGEVVWPSDLVELDGRRTVRISAMSVAFIVEDSGSIAVRQVTYTGGTILNRGGYDLFGILAQNQSSAVNQTFVYGGNAGDIIARQSPVSSVVVP